MLLRLSWRIVRVDSLGGKSINSGGGFGCHDDGEKKLERICVSFTREMILECLYLIRFREKMKASEGTKKWVKFFLYMKISVSFSPPLFVYHSLTP